MTWMKDTVTLVLNREIEEFDAAIVKSGFEIPDFGVLDVVDGRTSTGDQTKIGTVTVRRFSTDEFITYRWYSGSTWTLEFADDLQAGKFGEP